MLDEPLAGSNVGIIANPLTEDATLVAATRPIPNGLATSLALSGDDRYLFATYQGIGSVLAWDVAEMIKTIDDPTIYQIDNQGRGIDSPNFPLLAIPPFVRQASVEDLKRFGIGNFNSDINIANDLQPYKTTPFSDYRFVENSDQAPITVGGNPYSITNASWIDHLDLLPIEDTLTFNENITSDLTPTFQWEINEPESNIQQINLYVSVHPQEEGLLPEDRWGELDDIDSIRLPGISSVQQKQEFLGAPNILNPNPANRLWDWDYNPNRILSVSWVKDAQGNGQWYLADGSEVDNQLINDQTFFTLPDNRTLTAGQTYHWAVQVTRENDEPLLEVGTFETELPEQNFGNQNSFRSVTVLTHGFTPPLIQEQNIPASFVQMAHDIANPNSRTNGLVMKYDKFTGNWVPVDRNGNVNSNFASGRNPNSSNYSRDLKNYIENNYLGQPLVLLPDWASGNESNVYNAGFTEGAGDALFASLVKLDLNLGGEIGNSTGEIYRSDGKLIRQQGALFDSPLHFIGFSRGTVVNSELIQRLGTYYPHAGGPINVDGSPVLGNNGNPLRDLQMTNLDPHDFYQPSLGLYSDFEEPKVQIWENVTFADNYYQTVPTLYGNGTTFTPAGRQIPYLPNTEISKSNFDSIPGLNFPRNSNRQFLGQPDISKLLGTNNNRSLHFTSRAGFTRETDQLSIPGLPEGLGDVHGRVNRWYAGTVDLNSSQNDNEQLYRRRGDGYYGHFFDEDFYEDIQPELNPSYTSQEDTRLPDSFSLGDSLAPWEGIGSGWFYSVLGGGKEKRPQTSINRVPLTFDNTYETRMRGDFAVPTLFNGNFDAVSQRRSFTNGITQPIPGWSFHNSDNNAIQQQLVDRQDRTNFPRTVYNPNARPNYALQLNSGDSITHNRFVVPDWGNLRFGLYAPNSLDGTLKVSLLIGGQEVKQESINLKDDANVNLSSVDRSNPMDVRTIYSRNINKIGYGRYGFETFQLNLQDNIFQQYRGKTATLTFEFNGTNGQIYLDDIFFKSEHLKLGNPTTARWDSNSPNNNPYSNNVLLEKPQYVSSYNFETKLPNWVSWKVDKSWTGRYLRDSFITTPSLRPAPQFISDPNLPSNDWRLLPNNNRYDGRIYSDTGLDKGHLTPVEDRGRHPKDILATYTTSNLIPQYIDNNEYFTDNFNNEANNSPWFNIEKRMRQFANRNNNPKEIYVIAGHFGNDWTQKAITNSHELLSQTNPNRNYQGNINSTNFQQNQINIPEWTWKTYVMIDPGAEIDLNAEIRTYLTYNGPEPNQWSQGQNLNSSVSHPFNSLGIFGNNNNIDGRLKWRFDPNTWTLSLNQLETILNQNVNLPQGQRFNFLSNLPQNIQDNLKDRNVRNPSASLFADMNQSFSHLSLIENEWNNKLSYPNTIDENLIDYIKVNQTGIQTSSSLIPISPLQIDVNQIDFVTSHSLTSNNVPQITTNQFDTTEISSAQINTSEITEYSTNIQLGIGKVSCTKVDTNTPTCPSNTSQISTSQISLVQDNIFKVPFTFPVTSKQFLFVQNMRTLIADSSIGHDNTVKNSFGCINIGYVSSCKIGIEQEGTSQISTSQVSTSQVSTSQVSTSQVTIPQISIPEIRIVEETSNQVGAFKINMTQVGINQKRLLQGIIQQNGILEIDTIQISEARTDASTVTNKISFPSIIPSKQFFSVHDSNHQIINQLHNSVNHIWSTLLPQTNIDITYEIKDLPTRQLAEATITGFDLEGKPNAGIVSIDHDANGLGWFIDPTPLDNAEYSINNTDWAFQATPDSPAYGKYDLLTTILHETAHLYGFINGYSGFDSKTTYINGRRNFVGDNFTALLSVDGSHLDKQAHPHDLLNTHLAPGIRKLPSDINVLILNAIQKGKGQGAKGKGIFVDDYNHDDHDFTASLTSSGLMAEILNGDFAISNNTNPDYGWNNRGAATVNNDRAILTEDSSYLSNFTQSFIVPQNSQTLQFSFNAQLGNGDTNNSILPPDAFEVALLDANNLQPILGNTLSNTDSFFNLQNDGTAHFDDKVRLGGTSSGEQIELGEEQTVTVDISHIAPGTKLTLYFDLLGFGEADSTIYLDNVKIDNQSVTAPLALNDLISIDRGENIVIDVLANDSDRDGTLIPNSLQITSQPNNGVITVNSQGIVDYQPDSEFVGIDRFTYTVEDNDGNLSNQATVTVLVNNSAPVIDEITIDDTITQCRLQPIVEGVETTITATASDTENDTFTYNWLVDNQEFTGDTLDYTFVDNGNYPVTLTVTDSYGGSTSQTISVTVENATPIVEVRANITVNEGETFTLTGSYSDTGIYDNHSYQWNFGNGDSSLLVIDNGLTIDNDVTTTYAYEDDGVYLVTLNVDDYEGGIASDTMTVTVNNVAPVINSINGETEINQGEFVSYNAIASDAGNDTLTYEWDFGDDSPTQNGINVNHVFADNGDYTITLTVTDDDGGVTTQTLDVVVSNLPPTIEEIIGETSMNEGEEVSYEAFVVDEGDGILTYTWDFGDSSGLITIDDVATVNHTYQDNGNYTITLTITDDDGGETSQTLDVVVNNVSPVIDEIIGSNNVNEGEEVSYSAIVSDVESDTLTYSWDFGDGNSTTGENVTHTFADNGNYTITLTVTDDDGGVTSQTLDVVVNTINPGQITKLKFVQNQLKSKIYEDGVEVEFISGSQNLPLSNDFERITITAIDSPDIPNSKTDVTFLDRGEGIGVTDGDDGNSSLKKRINGDEALVISINETANYNSATKAKVTVDRIQQISNGSHGGQVKIVALQKGEIVGEELFTLTSRKQTLTFNNQIPFNDLYLMAGDNKTKLTFRNVEFDAVKTNLPVKNSLKLQHNGNDLSVLRNNVEIDNQTSPRLIVTATDDGSNSQISVDSSGIGIINQNDNATLNKSIDGDETLRVSLQPTTDYNAALSISIELAQLITAGEIKVSFFRDGLLVSQNVQFVNSNKNILTIKSNLAFDTVEISAGDDNVQFSIKSIDFETVKVTNPETQLTFYQDGLTSKVFVDGYLVEEYNRSQNQTIISNMERLTVTAIDSDDNKVDQTYLDRGEGLGIRDGDDGNSSLKKRIDRDEVLSIALNSNTEFATATSAVVSLDRIQQINGNSHGGTIKLVALSENSIIKEEVFTLTNIKDKITFNSEVMFDELRIMAGDNDTKFTFRSVNFTTISSWVEENNF